ncbi:hypothetical protein G9C98_007967 [Cotesia typhae]|uniref:Uncharacterized protein n=1 Tax=Cotesia typhae TaxID=2053667 RepID=A0A8J5UWR9_9HYME|nr:hypothetical protein G9C98_007967 [Cotesia typhae]
MCPGRYESTRDSRLEITELESLLAVPWKTPPKPVRRHPRKLRANAFTNETNGFREHVLAEQGVSESEVLRMSQGCIIMEDFGLARGTSREYSTSGSGQITRRRGLCNAYVRGRRVYYTSPGPAGIHSRYLLFHKCQPTDNGPSAADVPQTLRYLLFKLPESIFRFIFNKLSSHMFYDLN